MTALVAALTWCATAGAFGFALLVAGWYVPIVVGGVATVVALAASVAVRRLGTRDRGEPGTDHRGAAAAVGIVLVFFVLAGAFHSEHLLSDRDPGQYLTVGRSIARTHELKPKTRVGPFAVPSFGDPNARSEPDFFPMLPVVLAMGWSIGGDTGLLLVGPVLGALGLLAGYALATRILGTRVALLVSMLMVIAPLQLWFARDAYSELLVQFVVLGGLWLFLEARTRASWHVAAIAGALVASSTIARIDALAIVAGALVVVAVEWARTDTEVDPIASRRTVAAFGLALVGTTLIAMTTTFFVEHRYVTSLGTQYGLLIAEFTAAVAGVVVVAVVHRKRPGLGRGVAELRALFVAAT
ncbi:MAG: hypothetical protein QOI08_4161, partial [Actinomycetota bacterium]|nr:hypothetical protein [Actinomycetota bacterium]